MSLIGIQKDIVPDLFFLQSKFDKGDSGKNVQIEIG